MIRFLQFWVLGIGATLRYGLGAIAGAYRGVKDEPGGHYDRMILGWSRALLRAGRITLRIEGFERLQPRPCVYVANHVSMIDIWVLVTALPAPPKFVFKKELLRVPVIGRAARAAGHICIDRRNRAKAFSAYVEAAETIRAGKSAAVFAEGTRSRDGRFLPFKKGPFVLAIAAQVPVVPILIEGSHALMPRRAVAPRAGEVTLSVGEDIPTAGMGYDDRDQLSGLTRRALLAMGGAE
jgi:1-acyl-sn-glycerol-3-phosphate acyltransferase